MAASERLETVRTALAAARKGWGQRGEVIVPTGAAYAEGEPVRVLVRKRAQRYELSDRGCALALAGGKPSSWLSVAQGVVEVEGLKVNRSGVVYVQAGARRDLAALAIRVADTSLSVYYALLEAQGRRHREERVNGG